MFWGITAVVSPFPEIEAPIVAVIGQLCGFFWALGVGLALLRVLPGDATDGAITGNVDKAANRSEPSVTEPEV